MQPYVDKDILLEFDEEVRDYLPEIRNGLAALTADPTHPEAAAEVHRLIHTIKGAAAMIGFDEMSSAAADVEERLENASETKTPLDAGAVAELGRQVDSIEERLKDALAALNDSVEDPLPEPSDELSESTTPLLRAPMRIQPEQRGEPAVEQEPAGPDPEALRRFEETTLDRLDLATRRLAEAQFDRSRVAVLEDVGAALNAIAQSAEELERRETAAMAAAMAEALSRHTTSGEAPDDAGFELFLSTTALLGRLARQRRPNEDTLAEAERLQTAYVEAAAAPRDVANLAAAVEEPCFEELDIDDLARSAVGGGEEEAATSLPDEAVADTPGLFDELDLLEGEPAAVESTEEEPVGLEPASESIGGLNDLIDAELLETFQEEAEEHLSAIGEHLAALQQDPDQPETIREVRRSFHTIKGAAAMVGVQPPSELARRCENLLDELDEAGSPLTTPIILLLSKSKDVLADLASGNPRTTELEVKLKALFALLEEEKAAVAAPAAEEPASADAVAVSEAPPMPIGEAEEQPVDEAQPEGQFDDAFADELLETFREEAAEHLSTISKHLRALEQDAAQPERLQEVRRSVHTIKGAAGMVGLTAAGELAHHCEDLLDRLYEGERELTSGTIQLLHQTTDALEDLASGRTPTSELSTRLTALHARFDEETAAIETPSDSADDESSDLAGGGEVDAPAAEDSVEPDFDAEQLAGAGEDPEDAAQDDSAVDRPASDAFSAELLETFQEEAEDNLAMIAEHLRALETNPHQPERVQEVRRGVHTLKGAAGMVGLHEAGRLAHHCEDLLDRIYEGQAELTESVIQTLFGAADALEDLSRAKPETPEFVERIESLHSRLDEELAKLGEALSGEPAAVQQSETVEEAPVEVAGERPAEVEAVGLDDAPDVSGEESVGLTLRAQPEPVPGPGRAAQYVRVPLDRVEELIKLVNELLVNRSALDQHYTQYMREVGEMGLSVDRFRRLTTKLETEYTTGQLTDPNSLQRADVRRMTPGVATSSAKEFDELEFDRYTEFHLISRDMTETSVDLASANTSLRGLAGSFHASILRINRLTSEMQDRLMRLSMSPLSSVENRLHRTVRVTAEKRDRLVDFHLEGSAVELDKGILEDIIGPLEHLLRNAVDHGIEPAEERRAAGKHERGAITIRAILEGAQVSIEVRDDGRGLNAEKLRRKAVERGLYSEADAKALSKRELYSLLFQPGFSTATEVSDISGRGVGLDVVRSTVLALNGSVSIESEEGFGTTFLIRLPTTLAVTRVLVVEANEQAFAVPAHAVEQVLRYAPTELDKANGKTWVHHNGQRIEVVGLADSLGLPGQPIVGGDKIPLLAIDSGDRLFALAVDKILEGQEVVVKTLGGLLRRVHGIGGATTRGDGSVMLILSPAELGRPAAAPPVRAAENEVDRKPLILVADDSLSVRRVLTKVLSSNGFEMIVAKDGAEAVELLESAKRKPDALLLDVEMPRMDGYEVVAAVRGRPELGDAPIVMLTSRAGQKHRQKAFDLGATDYLVKPFQQDKLLETLRGVIAGARAARA